MNDKTIANGLVPELRFREFEKPWEEKRLGEFMNFKNGINAGKEQYGHGRKFINVLDIISDEPIVYERIIGSVDVPDKEFDKNEVLYGDILFQRSSEIREEAGQANVYLDKSKSATFGGFVIRGRAIAKINPIYLNLLLKTAPVRKEVTTKSGGSTRFNVGQETLGSVKVVVSGDELEQEKVAAFLTSIDEKLKKLRRKHELLGSYKRGLMQKVFSQQVRFKNSDGAEFPDWKLVAFREVFSRVTSRNKENNKNVLTISAQKGLVNQEEYFNKSVSAQDVSGYYLLEKNDFAYNKSYSKGYPMGAIKRLTKYDKGVVSTLYICFRAKSSDENGFYEQYFNSGLQNRELHKIAQEGARNHGLLNMSVVEFFSDVQIPRPNVDEQKKIAAFLNDFDQKIEAVAKQVEQLDAFKKGLLQKLFV